jgi:hypothetical protein
MANFVLTADQEVPVSVAFTDDHGNPAQVDGAPTWASSDDTILSVTPAADGLSAIVAAVGPDGSAQVSVTANANMDPNGAPIPVMGLLGIDVVSGAAASAVLTPGAPVPTPAPAGP